MKFSIIRTGVANLASVQAAFRRLHIATDIVETPADLTRPDAVVLPGVGAFEAGIKFLSEQGWDKLLVQRFENNEPTLAICLGMQLLCRSSEESLGCSGLNVLAGNVVRFPSSVTVPQYGWNSVDSEDAFFEPGYAYFANSFCLPSNAIPDDGCWEVLRAVHGIPFVAAAKKGNWLVCQFHPELSGSYGSDLISRWTQSFTQNAVQNQCDY